MKVPALLKNKYICYALMALATLNIIGYVTVRAWECLALFALAGYSCHCYCKNVSCSILAALFVANFVFGCGRVKEGFEDALKGPVEKMTEAAGLLQEAANECKVKAGGTNANCADVTALDDDSACNTASTANGITGAANACEWAAATATNAAATMAEATDQASCELAGGKTFTAATGTDAKSCV